MSVAVLSGCGRAAPPPAAAPPPEVAPEPPPSPPMQARSELGTIDEDATEGAFRRLEAPMMACHRRGLRRVRSLGGDVQFFVRVGEDGVARTVHLMESTLGDRETERCMLDLLARAEWPKPRGGEAEVKKKLGFDPPGDARKPVDWPADRLTQALHDHGEEARRCKSGGGGGGKHDKLPGRREGRDKGVNGKSDRGAPSEVAETGTFYVTMYIAAKGPRRGRVQAVGVSPPSAKADEQSDCIVEALKALPVPSPGRGIAKVSFVL